MPLTLTGPFRGSAAGVLVAGRGVVAGWAAAELLGASSGPPDALVDVLMPHAYRCDGLVVHRTALHADEVRSVGATTVTAAGSPRSSHWCARMRSRPWNPG